MYHFQKWTEHCVVVDPESRATTKELRDSYVSYCKAIGVAPWGRYHELIQFVDDKYASSVYKVRPNNRPSYVGLRVVPVGEDGTFAADMLAHIAELKAAAIERELFKWIKHFEECEASWMPKQSAQDDDSGSFGLWMGERTLKDAEGHVRAKELFEDFNRFCRNVRLPLWTYRQFRARMMEVEGVRHIKPGNVSVFKGITLKPWKNFVEE